MLLEVENQLHKRVHETLGQSAVVLRLAESLDESGRVAEQAMIIVSFTSSSTANTVKGAYIPTVRNRTMNFTITLVQKQAQREGHSFCLPILDLIADSVTGWVPPIPGIEWQTGFELDSEKFVQVTKEASQFIYEQNYSITANLVDGRFYSTPCAAYDPIKVEDFLPVRKCLLTPTGRQTGLSVWRRSTGPDTVQKYVVEDVRCPRAIGDKLSVQCVNGSDGDATYAFIPLTATNDDGSVDQSQVISGTLSNVWKCTKEGIKSGKDLPEWFKLNIEGGLWRNTSGTIPNTDPTTSSYQPLQIGLNPVYNEQKAT